MSLNLQIEAVRRFNRFYTRRVGLLRKTFLGTPWTLGETRVLYEIWLHPGILARDVAERLDLDTAYLSRLLARFEREGQLKREKSARDGRQFELFLTDVGSQQMVAADVLQRAETERSLKALSEDERKELTEAMSRIEALLSKAGGETHA